MPTRDDAWPAGTPNWVDLAADDPQAAAEFYSQLFGWDVADPDPETAEQTGGYRMAMKNGRAAAGIGSKMGQDIPSNWATYLASDDIEASAEAVKAAGGTLQMDPFDVMTFGKMFFATAPDGASFGVWQAGDHIGAQIYNEPGSYNWNEVHSRDLDAAKEFYASAFGYTYDDMSGEQGPYFGFKVPGGDEPVGGMGPADMLPEGAPSIWLAWFSVEDCDASVAKVQELGGSVLAEPFDTPFGRMSVVTGAQGEAFGMISAPAAAEA
ncbi:hypothetical protein HNR19_002356 [Nocardioides thalensis]|uniref:VOC domain-containing protein n=1 Tax=Nocardioides thalensis TaxID=1914755 RepID=A0A853C555_9ACTN|nr:VOC family protein [Nocardioides thalensis]NYJ01658.1 hypothetical protein [Nocardioides thalensis]